jgi:4,5-dihydroxyphthalate decarboxylase
MRTSRKISLKTAFNNTNPGLESLRNGSIEIRGVEMDAVDSANMVAIFRRMCRRLEFDISEMAVVTYYAARHYGLPMTGIPVFPSSQVNDGAGITYNAKTGVTSPKDFEGKTVGMRAYTVTPATWQRGYLAEQGVDLGKVNWLSATEEHVDAYHKDSPPNLTYDLSADLTKMLAVGEIAGGLGVPVPDNPDVKEMFPDARAQGIETFKQTGVYRLIHMMVVKDSVLEENPWVLEAVYEAFKASKEEWLRQRGGAPLEPWEDPMPIGMSQTRASNEKLMHHSVESRILPNMLDLNEIFPGNFD